LDEVFHKRVMVALIWSLLILLVLIIWTFLALQIITYNDTKKTPITFGQAVSQLLKTLLTGFGQLFYGLYTYIVLIFVHLRTNWMFYLVAIVGFIFLFGYAKYNNEIIGFAVEKYETVIYPFFIKPFWDALNFFANLVDIFICWYDLYVGVSKIVITEAIVIAKNCDEFNITLVWNQLFLASTGLITSLGDYVVAMTADPFDLVTPISSLTEILNTLKPLIYCECQMIQFWYDYLASVFTHISLAEGLDSYFNFLLTYWKMLYNGVIFIFEIIITVVQEGIEGVISIMTDPTHFPTTDLISVATYFSQAIVSLGEFGDNWLDSVFKLIFTAFIHQDFHLPELITPISILTTYPIKFFFVLLNAVLHLDVFLMDQFTVDVPHFTDTFAPYYDFIVNVFNDVADNISTSLHGLSIDVFDYLGDLIVDIVDGIILLLKLTFHLIVNLYDYAYSYIYWTTNSITPTDFYDFMIDTNILNITELIGTSMENTIYDVENLITAFITFDETDIIQFFNNTLNPAITDYIINLFSRPTNKNILEILDLKNGDSKMSQKYLTFMDKNQHHFTSNTAFFYTIADNGNSTLGYRAFPNVPTLTPIVFVLSNLINETVHIQVGFQNLAVNFIKNLKDWRNYTRESAFSNDVNYIYTESFYLATSVGNTIRIFSLTDCPTQTPHLNLTNGTYSDIHTDVFCCLGAMAESGMKTLYSIYNMIFRTFMTVTDQDYILLDRLILLFEPFGFLDIENNLLVHLNQFGNATACLIPAILRYVDIITEDDGGFINNLFICQGGVTGIRMWTYLQDVIYNIWKLMLSTLSLVNVVNTIFYEFIGPELGNCTLEGLPCKCVVNGTNITAPCECKIVLAIYRIYSVPILNILSDGADIMYCVLGFGQTLRTLTDNLVVVFGVGGTAESLLCTVFDVISTFVSNFIIFWTDGVIGLLQALQDTIVDFINAAMPIIQNLVDWVANLFNIIQCIITELFDDWSFADVATCISTIDPCMSSTCYSLMGPATGATCATNISVCDCTVIKNTCCFGSQPLAVPIYATDCSSLSPPMDTAFFLQGVDSNVPDSCAWFSAGYVANISGHGACVTTDNVTTGNCNVLTYIQCATLNISAVYTYHPGAHCLNASLPVYPACGLLDTDAPRPALRSSYSSKKPSSSTLTTYIAQYCESQYINYQHEGDNSPYKKVLENDYKKCVFSTKLAKLLNYFMADHPDDIYVDPYVIYDFEQTEDFLYNMTSTAVNVYNYSMSNMSVEFFIYNSSRSQYLDPFSIKLVLLSAYIRYSDNSFIQAILIFFKQIFTAIAEIFDLSYMPLYFNRPLPHKTPLQLRRTFLVHVEPSSRKTITSNEHALIRMIRNLRMNIHTTQQQIFNKVLVPTVNPIYNSIKSNLAVRGQTQALGNRIYSMSEDISVISRLFKNRILWNYNGRDPKTEPFPRGISTDRNRWETLYRKEQEERFPEQKLKIQKMRDELYPEFKQGYLLSPSSVAMVEQNVIIETDCPDLICNDYTGHVVGVCNSTGLFQCSCSTNYTASDSGACCADYTLINATCQIVANSSFCPGVFFPGSTCDESANTTVCNALAVTASDPLIGACCLQNETRCVITTEAGCGLHSWSSGKVCNANTLPEACNVCESFNIDPVTITGEILCPGNYKSADTIVYNDCDDRNMYGIDGTIIGTCSEDPYTFVLGNPVCLETSTITGFVPCCIVSNSSCVNTSSVAECIAISGATFTLEGETCDSCFVLVNSTYGACCVNETCSLLTDSACTSADGVFSPSKTCRSSDLPTECNACKAPGCRQCWWLLNVLNDLIDYIFHCWNNIITDSSLVFAKPLNKAQQYKEIHRILYNDKLMLKQNVIPVPTDNTEAILYWILDEITLAYNYLFGWYFGEYEFRDVTLAAKDYVLNPDSSDPNGLLYHILWYVGIGCDVLESVDEDRGLPGYGIWPTFFFILAIFGFLYFLLSYISSGFSIALLIFLSGYFLKYWIAIAFNMQPGCLGTGILPNFVVVPTAINPLQWWYSFNLFLLPENIAFETVNAFSWANVPSIDTYICPDITLSISNLDCYASPYYFRDGFRNIFYFFHYYTPAFYASVLTTFSTIVDIPLISSHLVFADTGVEADFFCCNRLSLPNIIPIVAVGVFLMFNLWLIISAILPGVLTIFFGLRDAFMFVGLSIYTSMILRDWGIQYLTKKSITPNVLFKKPKKKSIKNSDTESSPSVFSRKI